MRVPLYIDNSAFQLSGVKGWSKADRLNDLLKQVFRYSVEFGCIFIFFWISTHENVLADALSRVGAPATFLDHPRLREFLQPGAVLQRHASGGKVRRLWGKGFSSSTDGDGPPRAGFPFALTVSYSRVSIYDGLPSQEVALEVDKVMDNRLGSSSHQSVRASLAHWDRVILPRVLAGSLFFLTYGTRRRGS